MKHFSINDKRWLATLLALVTLSFCVLATPVNTSEKEPSVHASSPDGLTISNNILEVTLENVTDGDGFGTYTISTGPGHTNPSEDVFYGGASYYPWTTYNTIHVTDTSRDYVTSSEDWITPDPGFALINMDTLGPTVTTSSPTRIAIQWTTLENLLVEQDIEIIGTTMEDTYVRVTMSVTNNDLSAHTVGIRYEWDLMIDGVDGSWIRPWDGTAGSWMDKETSWTPPTFHYWETTNDPVAPIFSVLGSNILPSMAPSPTSPDTFMLASWIELYDRAYSYTPTGQIVAGIGQDSAVAYYWDPVDVPPEGTISETAYVWSKYIPPEPDWPMFHHDPAHKGYSTSPAPDTDNVLWSYTTGNGVLSSPAIVKGKVYMGSCDDKVYCLDAASGLQVWNYTTTPGDFVRSSPAVAEGKVYVGASDCNVYCLDAASGSLVWNYTTTGGTVWSSPAVVDEKVYVGSQNWDVYCLNATSGSLGWSYRTGGVVRSSPAVVHGRVYVGSEDNKVYCLDAGTGAYIWSYTTEGDVYSSPAVAEGKVYVGSKDAKVYCLDANSGDEIWNYTTGGEVESSPAVANGMIYVGSWDDKVYCLNATTGSLVWSYTTGGTVSSSPAVADGKVYVGSWDGKVYCFGSTTTTFTQVLEAENVRMIYPSDTTPKPLGCGAAWVSDWLASAFIYTKLENVIEGLDTEEDFVNQTTGKALGDTGTGIISFGGQFVNPVVKYAESDGTPEADKAPVKFYLDGSTFRFQYRNGTNIPGAELPQSVINVDQDMFVIEVYEDGDGRYMMLCYGFGWKGTYAAGKYFHTEIYPDLESYPCSWIIVKWDDANGNGFVNTGAEGDTYTVIATG